MYRIIQQSVSEDSRKSRKAIFEAPTELYSIETSLNAKSANAKHMIFRFRRANFEKISCSSEEWFKQKRWW